MRQDASAILMTLHSFGNLSDEHSVVADSGITKMEYVGETSLKSHLKDCQQEGEVFYLRVLIAAKIIWH
jgi:hypothetical protein